MEPEQERVQYTLILEISAHVEVRGMAILLIRRPFMILLKLQNMVGQKIKQPMISVPFRTQAYRRTNHASCADHKVATLAHLCDDVAVYGSTSRGEIFFPVFEQSINANRGSGPISTVSQPPFPGVLQLDSYFAFEGRSTRTTA
jgi:hypothetical protein